MQLKRTIPLSNNLLPARDTYPAHAGKFLAQTETKMQYIWMEVILHQQREVQRKFEPHLV